jgi:multicomponent Na+:H+ antiporter subunit B
MTDINVILILMIAGSIIAVETKDMLSCVVVVGVVGLFQSLAFLVLKAPDLAIVQLVVEILSLVILLRIIIRKETPEPQHHPDYFPMLMGITLSVLVLLFIYPIVDELPQFGQPVMRVAKEYIETGMKVTGATNLVSSVILDFRAYDTLGEAVVLFTAICGAVVVLRKTGRKKSGESETEA